VTCGRVTCKRGTDYKRAYTTLFGKSEIWGDSGICVIRKDNVLKLTLEKQRKISVHRWAIVKIPVPKMTQHETFKNFIIVDDWDDSVIRALHLYFGRKWFEIL